jgi:hypothetical protein
MRRAFGSLFAAAVFVLPAVSSAQDGESSRAVAGGGVSVAGWTAKIDATEEAKGMKMTDQKFEKMGDGFHITTGPATTYWNPANKATGNYTVKATFNEAKYMNLNDHPHPYGIMIGGNDLGSADASYLYCAAYGNGTFIVRGFAPGTPRGTFQMGGRAAAPNDAINKAAGKDQPVKQEIAIQVSADKVDCIINGKSVASFPKSEVVGAGKLKSTDGVYGIRSAHNTEVHVSGFTMTKN